MRKIHLLPGLLALACAFVLPTDVGAQSGAQVTYMRLATLTPRTAPLRRAVRRWNRSLSERTDGRVQVRVYWGGSMGDERTMLRRMRIGQLDAASMTSSGLSQIVREVLVMQVPGVFQDYAQVDRVRRAIGPRLATRFVSEGFHLLSWGDAGRIRLFSQQPIRRPTDLRSRRPWVPRTDTIFRELLRVTGATGVPLSVGEVFGGLRTRMIDVVPASALAVGGLQWFTSLRYVTRESDGFLIGGMVVRNGFLEGLSETDRVGLIAASGEGQDRFARVIRRGDERAYAALTSHGLEEVDNGEFREEWVATARETRRRLSGRIFPAALLQEVERIAAASSPSE